MTSGTSGIDRRKCSRRRSTSFHRMGSRRVQEPCFLVFIFGRYRFRQTVSDQAIATASRIAASLLACSADTGTTVALAAMLERIAGVPPAICPPSHDGLLPDISRAIEAAVISTMCV